MMLQFKGLSGHKTKRIVFEDALRVLDSGSLEQLKELTSKRRLIEESINETSCITEATAREMYGGLSSRLQQDLQKLEQYLPLLENLILCVDLANASQRMKCISELKIRWTSTLSSSSLFRIKGPKFFQIDSLSFEHGMTLFVYGVALYERALEVLSEDLQESASLLKKAAGVYSYLSTDVLPLLLPILPPEKPPEVTTTLSSIMSLFCLAQAQAIAIKKAEKMEMSVGNLSKLHYGVSQYLGEAIALLQLGSKDSKDVSKDFVDFLHVCRILHELRSSRYLAESYKVAEQVGIAVGILRLALGNSKKHMPSQQAWRTIFKKEVNEVTVLLRSYEEENAFGWRQKIPIEFELPPSEGTKVVTATLYKTQRWERQFVFKT